MQVDVRIEIGQHVHAADGDVLGHIDSVVSPPSLHRVTHVVISPEEWTGSRLVPIDDLHDEGGDLILDSPDWPDGYDVAEEVDLVALDRQLQTDLSLAFPLGDIWMFPSLSLPTGHRRLALEHLPEGEVSVSAGSRVVGPDGPVGTVVGVLIDPSSDDVTHVLVRHGHLWRRRALAIPIDLVAGMEDGEIHIAATSGELEEYALPH